MKCSKCLTNEASIHVLNQGDFCHTCHQVVMDELGRGAEIREIPKIVTVKDVCGVDHQFEISMGMTAHLANWKAKEIDGGYHFQVLSKLPESQDQGFDRLIEKITKRLQAITLDQGVSLTPVLKMVAAQKLHYLEFEELTSL